MAFISHSRKFLLALILALFLVTSTACSGLNQADRSTSPSVLRNGAAYEQIERGDTQQGQDFGDWVVQAGRGLIQETYVRDNNKLGVVITPQVRPNEVRSLAHSLVEGFHKNFPNRDLTVLVYAPDKELILTAQYNNTLKQIQYQ
jgi:hypothetical protein